MPLRPRRAVMAATRPPLPPTPTTTRAPPPPRFVVVTTAGVVEVERQRPVDVLAELLAEGGRGGSGGAATSGLYAPGGILPSGARPASSPPRLDAFVAAYGASETAALCYALATAPPPTAPPATRAAAAAALAHGGPLAAPPGLLDAPALDGGVDGAGGRGPSARGDGGAPPLAPPHPVGVGAFDMGGAVPLAADPDWSPAHRGLCAYVARLLAPAWDARLLAPSKGDRDRGGGVLSRSAARTLEARLRALAAFVVGRRGGLGGAPTRAPSFLAPPRGVGGEPAAKRARLEEAAAAEAARTAALASLAQRAAEGLFLWRLLSEAGVARLAARAGGGAPQSLATARLRDWVAHPEGDATASSLVAALVGEAAASGPGAADELASALASGCPSYFRPGERAFYEAAAALATARAAPAGPDRDRSVAGAVASLLSAPLAADLGRVLPQLAALGAWEAAVDVTAAKATALDPSRAADAPGDAGVAARGARAELCYAPLAALLRALGGGDTERDGPCAPVAALPPATRSSARAAFLRARRRLGGRRPAGHTVRRAGGVARRGRAGGGGGARRGALAKSRRGCPPRRRLARLPHPRQPP